MSDIDLLANSDDIQEAKREIQDEIRQALGEITLKYGRSDTANALRKVYAEYSARRFVNPYPIPDRLFRELVKKTEGDRLMVEDQTPEEVAESVRDRMNDLPDDKAKEIDSIMEEYGEQMIFTYTDLMLGNLFHEERDEYVAKVAAEVIDIVEEDQ